MSQQAVSRERETNKGIRFPFSRETLDSSSSLPAGRQVRNDGQGNPVASYRELQIKTINMKELLKLQSVKKYDIDYYFVWGKADNTPHFLTAYKEVTNGEFPDLKIYFLREK